MNNIKKRKIKEIANFIVNNITLAEVSTIIIERAMKTAEFIVRNDLAPEDFNSVVSRKRLYQKLAEEKLSPMPSKSKPARKPKKVKSFIKKIQPKRKEEKGWLQSIIDKVFKKEEKKEEDKAPSPKKFTTRKK